MLEAFEYHNKYKNKYDITFVKTTLFQYIS